MGIFKKQASVKAIVMIVALLLVVGLVGGVLAAMKTPSETSSSKTVTASSTSSSSSNSGSSSSNSENGSGASNPSTYTLYYDLGDYGTGNVPDPVTVDEGETVEINFSTVPSYDGEGKVFAGWAATDGASEATYTEDETDEITMNADVTLYPVFVDEPVIERTLTYAMGSYADVGSVPSSVTVADGSTVNIDFSPHPTKTDHNFVGWAYSDGASEAAFTEEGTNTIFMDNDETLYPVFEAVSPHSSVIVIDNTNKSFFTNVFDLDEGDQTVVQDGTTYTLNYTVNTEYAIQGSSGDSATFSGVYNGVTYTNIQLNVKQSDDYGGYTIGRFYNPTGNGETWTMSSGDYGTITVSDGK